MVGPFQGWQMKASGLSSKSVDDFDNLRKKIPIFSNKVIFTDELEQVILKRGAAQDWLAKQKGCFYDIIFGVVFWFWDGYGEDGFDLCVGCSTMGLKI